MGPSADEILARWEAGVPTPWIDPVDHEVVLAPGMPLAGVPLTGGAQRFLRYTFVLEPGAADRVLFWANRLSDETDLASTVMEPVPGTTLWSASFVMPADWRASYCFLFAEPGSTAPWEGDGDQIRIRAALDVGHGDARNPVSCRNRAGVVQSVVEGPDAARSWDASPEAARLPSDWVRRDVVVGERRLLIVEPRGLAAGAPLLVVLDGEVWDEHHALPAQVAALVASGDVRAQRLLLVPSGGREQRWQALAGDTDAHLAWLADVIAACSGAIDDAESVTLVGQSLGGVTALRGVLSRPDVFGWALSQSASTWLPGVASSLPTGVVAGGVHLAHGAQEWVLAPGHVEMAGSLRSAGVVTKESVHQGGHDYAWWRHGVVQALRWQEERRRAAAVIGSV